MAFYYNSPFVHHLWNCHCVFSVWKISKQTRHWHHVHWIQHTNTSKCYTCLRFVHWRNRTWTTTKSNSQFTDSYNWKHLSNCSRKSWFQCLWIEIFCNMIRLLDLYTIIIHCGFITVWFYPISVDLSEEQIKMTYRSKKHTNIHFMNLQYSRYHLFLLASQSRIQIPVQIPIQKKCGLVGGCACVCMCFKTLFTCLWRKLLNTKFTKMSLNVHVLQRYRERISAYAIPVNRDGVD